jgi:hypothetical protein
MKTIRKMMNKKALMGLGVMLLVCVTVAFAAVVVKGSIINALTGFQNNGAAPLNHTLCGNGTVYVDAATCGVSTAVDYYWTDTSCGVGVGQPTQCVGTTTLPGPMPNANWQFFCTADANGNPGNYLCAAHLSNPLPTASGSTLNYGMTQVMQNGGGGSTATMYFHAHHN